MIHRSSLWLLLIFVFCIVQGQAAHTHFSDSLAPLQQVKARALTYMLGETGSGPYRKKALQQQDEWVELVLARKFETLPWDESAALIMNQRLASFASDLHRLATAYRSDGSRFQKSDKVRQRVIAGLENILKYYNPETPRPGNWYQWLISLPNHLGAIGLLMESDLSPDLLSRLKKSLRYDLSPRLILTGTNASWEARNHIYLALLDGDLDRLERAADYIFRSVRFGPDQGIREDYAYLFHGHIPYAGGYGSGFAQTVSEFIYVFDETPWAISSLHRDIIRNLLLEHTRWFLVEGSLDLHVRGRSFKEGSGNWNSVLEALLVLSQAKDPRSHEVAETAAAMIRAQPEMNLNLTMAGFADKLTAVNGKLPLGFRYWSSSELGVHRRPSYHIGFRQFSDRVQDYEYLARSDGGSGGEGWNLPYGFTNILRNDGANNWYQKGDNRGMLSEIDLEHLPGTTARIGANPLNPPFKHDPKKQTMSTTGFSLNFGSSPFAGGAGWQDGGVAGFILEPVYGEFSANKSLHFFPDGYWALGSEIRSTKRSPESNDKPVHTTILQWVTNSTTAVIKVSDGALSLKAGGAETLKKLKWLWIDGENVGVVFNEPANVEVRLKGNVITVWLDHGARPSGARYAYAVLPDISMEGAKTFAATLPYRPIRHDSKVHAVTDKGRNHLGIVFFNADTCAGIRTAVPLIVHKQADRDGAVYTIQDPLHQNQKLNLAVDGLPAKIIKPDVLEVKNVTTTRVDIEISSVRGRIYRFGYGINHPTIYQEPRKDLDLSSYSDFRVDANSDAKKTILTVHLPDHAVDGDYKFSVHFSKSQRFHDFTEADVLDRPSRNVVRYQWIRKPVIGPPVFSEYLKQTEGRFNVQLVTDLIMTEDSFIVPASENE